MKKRIGKPDIGDILTEIVDVNKFEGLEGWDSDLATALVRFLLGTKHIKAKHTSCVFLSWQELSQQERLLLEQRIGKPIMGLLGLLFSTQLSCDCATSSSKEGGSKSGQDLDGFLKFLAEKGMKGKGFAVDPTKLPPELRKALDEIVKRHCNDEEGENG